MKVDSLTQVAEYARKRFADLASAYREDEAFSARLPADDGLVLLIEEAFWASISRDEGRACRFTIAYYRDEPGRGNPDITIALDPRPFGRDLLRRLAAVAFAADAKIAVSTVNGQLRIIGLSKHLLLTSEIADRAGLPIEIEVVGPGHMAIRHGIFRVLTYRGGSLPDPAPNIVHAVGPFRNALDKLAVAEGIPGEDLRFRLMGLLDRIERHAHGGLFLISSTKPAGLESISWEIRNDVRSLAEVHRLWWDNVRRLELPEDHADKISFDELRDRQRDLRILESELLALSASLTLTDGAVWLTGSLQPRAFGIFAQLGRRQRVSLASDAAGTALTEKRFDDLGARHRAVVALAEQNPDCPTIAISADGGFSAALRVGDRADVLMWRFDGGDLDVDDPFDPQYRAIWKELLARATGPQADQRPSPSVSAADE